MNKNTIVSWSIPFRAAGKFTYGLAIMASLAGLIAFHPSVEDEGKMVLGSSSAIILVFAACAYPREASKWRLAHLERCKSKPAYIQASKPGNEN